MRVRGLSAAAAAGVLSTSAALSAQATYEPYGGGTRIMGPPPAQIPNTPMSQEDKGRVATQELAGCLIKLHRSSVLKAVQPEPWEENARKMLVSVVDNRCLEEGALAVPPNLMRGAFYVQFYREAFSSAPPTLPPAAFDFSSAKAANLTDDAKTGIALLQFGDCVVRQDLNDAHALVLSRPGSPAEDVALNALVPHLGVCLVQGSKWTLNRSSISAVLGEVLYREGMQARGAGK